MTHDQFRALEEISGSRNLSNAMTEGGKADDLLAAAIASFAVMPRPGRQDMQQLEDLALPLLERATAQGRRNAAQALAQLEEAPRRLVLALAGEPTEISAPLLLRSPALRPADLIDLIGAHGIDHARVIARRQSADALLQQVLRSFADPAIDRTLAMQEDLADIGEKPAATAAVTSPLPAASAAHGLGLSLQQPFFKAEAMPGHQALIDAALLIDSHFFRNALADALDVSFARAESIIGRWPDSHLPIALKALGMSAPECYLVMTAALGPIDANRESLREFVHIYRSIDPSKAMALVRRWRADEMSAMLRDKLREMAAESARSDAANCDRPARPDLTLRRS